MAYIETELLAHTDDLPSVLRAAMASELDATNLYKRLADKYPQYGYILREIANDEIEHTGRLLSLICSVEAGYEESLNRGIDGE